jgi:hypothetical protein
MARQRAGVPVDFMPGAFAPGDGPWPVRALETVSCIACRFPVGPFAAQSRNL